MKLERFGMGLTLLCAVHCFSLPFLAGAASVLHDTPLENPWVEFGLLGSVALIGYATLGIAFRRHRRPAPLMLLTAGMGMMLLAHFTFPEEWETAGMLLGAASLLSAQILNGRCAASCCPAPCCGTDAMDRRAEAASTAG